MEKHSLALGSLSSWHLAQLHDAPDKRGNFTKLPRVLGSCAKRQPFLEMWTIQFADRWSVIRAINKGGEADAENFRELPSARKRHAVRPAFVFLNLLKRQADFVSKALLRETSKMARYIQIPPGNHIDWVGRFVRLRFNRSS